MFLDDRSIVISHGRKKAQNKCEQNGLWSDITFRTHKVSNVKVSFVNVQIKLPVTLTKKKIAKMQDNLCCVTTVSIILICMGTQRICIQL